MQNPLWFYQSGFFVSIIFNLTPPQPKAYHINSRIFNLNYNQLIQKKLIIYPNPNKGLFEIELKSNSQIGITNILGQLILNENK